MSQALPDILRGRVAWIFGDDFDVDLIMGVENIKYYDADHLRSVCMKAFEPDFVDKVQPGDVIVGGRNFGYGHPHYPPMVAMRNLGISAVIAESFSPVSGEARPTTGCRWSPSPGSPPMSAGSTGSRSTGGVRGSCSPTAAAGR